MARVKMYWEPKQSLQHILCEKPAINEPASVYILRIRQLGNSKWESMDEEKICDILVQNLPPQIGYYVLVNDMPDSFKKLINMVLDYEKQGNKSTGTLSGLEENKADDGNITISHGEVKTSFDAVNQKEEKKSTKTRKSRFDIGNENVDNITAEDDEAGILRDIEEEPKKRRS